MQCSLGKYTLIERLAVGGMAELFLAKAYAQHGFEKTVVLKRILPAFAENDDFVRMFMQEAHLAAGLHHPNIAQVYDFGEDNGTYFFTMEYVQGKNLREVLRAAAKLKLGFPLASIVHLIAGVAAGLHHAHQHQDADGKPLGVVHRDVSPANIIVTYDGHIKIVDFGIAKAAALGSGTHVGALKGKVPYMSPEQCRGEPVDRRSDIFSIGTLLWELSTARRLFSGAASEVAMLHQVANADIPAPTSIVAEYPVALEPIVLKALARERDDRFATAHELFLALEDFAHAARLPLSPTRLARYMDDLFPPVARPQVPRTGAFASLNRTRTTSVEATMGRTKEDSAGGASDAVVTGPVVPPPVGLPGGGPTAETVGETHGEARRYPWKVGALILLLLMGVGGGIWVLTAPPFKTPESTTAAPVAARWSEELAEPSQTAPEPPARPILDQAVPMDMTAPPVAQANVAEPPAGDPSGRPPGTPSVHPVANRESKRRRRARKRSVTRLSKEPNQEVEKEPAASEPEPSSPRPSGATQRPRNGVFLPSRESAQKRGHGSDDFL